jgi:hypothetical protein
MRAEFLSAVLPLVLMKYIAEVMESATQCHRPGTEKIVPDKTHPQPAFAGRQDCCNGI